MLQLSHTVFLTNACEKISTSSRMNGPAACKPHKLKRFWWESWIHGFRSDRTIFGAYSWDLNVLYSTRGPFLRLFEQVLSVERHMLYAGLIIIMTSPKTVSWWSRIKELLIFSWRHLHETILAVTNHRISTRSRRRRTLAATTYLSDRPKKGTLADHAKHISMAFLWTETPSYVQCRAKKRSSRCLDKVFSLAAIATSHWTRTFENYRILRNTNSQPPSQKSPIRSSLL